MDDTILRSDGRIRLIKIRTSCSKHLNRTIQNRYPLGFSENTVPYNPDAFRDEMESMRDQELPEEELTALTERRNSRPEAEPEGYTSQLNPTANAACRGEDVVTRQTRSGRVEG